jgi:hypothetical protein
LRLAHKEFVMRTAIVITAASLVLAAGPALATEEAGSEENGFFASSINWLSTDTYVGLNVGTASADVDEAALANSLTTATAVTAMDIDDGDTGYRFFVGKRFMPHLAVELGYANLGEIDVTVEATALDPAAYLQQLADNVPVAPSGMTLDAVTEWTFADFGAQGGWAQNLSVHGRLGLFLWETEVEYRNAGVAYSHDDDGADFRFGVGAGWRFNENFGMRFDWEQFSATTDVDMISLGALYRF